MTLVTRVRNLEDRMTAVGQILPTLATKADVVGLGIELRAEMAQLRIDLTTELRTEFRAELTAKLEAAVAPLATKAELAELRAEMREEAQATRRHFDVVAERMHDDVRIIAEGLVGERHYTEEVRADIFRRVKELAGRVTLLEASDARRG